MNQPFMPWGIEATGDALGFLGFVGAGTGAVGTRTGAAVLVGAATGALVVWALTTARIAKKKITSWRESIIIFESLCLFGWWDCRYDKKDFMTTIVRC